MELHGKLTDNLQAAIKSADRLSGQPVHRDTLQFWRELLAYARSSTRLADEQPAEVETLTGKLQEHLAAHEKQG